MGHLHQNMIEKKKPPRFQLKKKMIEINPWFDINDLVVPVFGGGSRPDMVPALQRLPQRKPEFKVGPSKPAYGQVPWAQTSKKLPCSVAYLEVIGIVSGSLAQECMYIVIS